MTARSGRQQTAVTVVSLATMITVFVVTMWQRVKEKKGEIGILKANGMTTGRLLVLYAMEGLAPGVAAAAPGLLLGLAAECLLNGFVQKLGDRSGNTLLFHLETPGLACLAGFALLVCPLVCVLASALSARTPPAQAVA